MRVHSEVGSIHEGELGGLRSILLCYHIVIIHVVGWLLEPSHAALLHVGKLSLVWTQIFVHLSLSISSIGYRFHF